ncbi:hypothetical protein CAOG_08682 [Capsaspora owczarzaki ATCC 30864]|uniref:DNA 3'-5' helicase n=1 Tax=Capsaspora owczarzaki (strain ATCC 30864) TaxID=595528 RepID=A0A0D2VPA0_CAPO3|nr:hypothetical protein CAOG_08682 [Capsaspora owczarzaki ATCC 30864]KJE92262.1 hypothetical protein CAOG_008682 [Capsaspora owczarzaki ATCC 30864]|eukprot:XP_011270293.1 hypothetical protein CAOG_08682 [Capsaspora owczarzaki ATCC 30864]
MLASATAGPVTRLKSSDAAGLVGILQANFNLTKLRPPQRKPIKAIIDNADVFCCLPTGAGKSLCYMFPALTVSRGITLVISPLIALMADQLKFLHQRNIPAHELHSALAPKTRAEIMADIVSPCPKTRLLYVTPELVATERFRSVLRRIHANGNLVHCDKIADALSREGVPSAAYHAGLSSAERTRVQSEWTAGRVPVIAATISFGMGIDKADVRFVVHWSMPKSLEAYFQESGRAGRDGLKSHCRIYASQDERDKMSFLVSNEARRLIVGEKAADTTDPAMLGDMDYWNSPLEGDSVARGGRSIPSSSAPASTKDSERSSAERQAAAMRSAFEAMVGYCAGVSCRHVLIASYFAGNRSQLPAASPAADDNSEKIDAHTLCNGMCDACTNQNAVATKAAMFSSRIGSYTSGSSNSSASAAKGMVALPRFDGGFTSASTYYARGGGGGGEDDDGGSVSMASLSRQKRRQEQEADRDKQELKRFLTEGRVERTVRHEDARPDTRLLDANNHTHIPFLLVTVREACFAKLLDAYTANYLSQLETKSSSLDAGVQEQLASLTADVEFSAFRGCSQVNTYKARVFKRVREVADATLRGVPYDGPVDTTPAS